MENYKRLLVWPLPSAADNFGFSYEEAEHERQTGQLLVRESQYIKIPTNQGTVSTGLDQWDLISLLEGSGFWELWESQSRVGRICFLRAWPLISVSCGSTPPPSSVLRGRTTFSISWTRGLIFSRKPGRVDGAQPVEVTVMTRSRGRGELGGELGVGGK